MRIINLKTVLPVNEEEAMYDYVQTSYSVLDKGRLRAINSNFILSNGKSVIVKEYTDSELGSEEIWISYKNLNGKLVRTQLCSTNFKSYCIGDSPVSQEAYENYLYNKVGFRGLTDQIPTSGDGWCLVN